MKHSFATLTLVFLGASIAMAQANPVSDDPRVQSMIMKAETGGPKAMRTLGAEFETGRGVPKDPAMALSLYRRAAGLSGTVNLESASSSASKEEVEQLLDAVTESVEEVSAPSHSTQAPASTNSAAMSEARES